MTPIIHLASSSPRRIQILEQFSLPFTQENPLFDEQSILWEGNPEEYAKNISEGKGGVASSHLPILSADTVVYKEKNVFGKPKDREDAYQMLCFLKGGWHSVFTAVTLTFAKKQTTIVQQTKVLFSNPTERQLQQALDALPWHDKAGAYLIQGSGAIMVQEIQGCYNNVIGLPIHAVQKLLATQGIDLWCNL